MNPIPIKTKRSTKVEVNPITRKTKKTNKTKSCDALTCKTKKTLAKSYKNVSN